VRGDDQPEAFSACGRKEGLQGPQICRKRRRIRPESALRHRAEYTNHVWAIDFQFDETADWRRHKISNVVDGYTGEALAMEVDRSTLLSA